MTVPLLAILALLCSLVLAIASPVPQFSPSLAVLWLSAMALSAAAVRLPGGAAYSAATPLLLACGVAPAALGLIVQAALYHLRGSRGRQTVLEWLAALPGLALLAWGSHFYPHPGWNYLAQAMYLGVLIDLRWRWAPHTSERVAYFRMQRNLRRLHLVTVLASNTPWALTTLPLLLSTHWAAANERFRVEAQIDEETQHELSQLAQQKDQVARELQASQQQRAWLEELTQNLVSVSDAKQWLGVVGQSLNQVTRLDSLLLYSNDPTLEGTLPLAEAPLPSPGRTHLALPLQEGLTLYIKQSQPLDMRWVLWTVRRAWPALASLLQTRQTQAKIEHLYSLLQSSQQLTAQLTVDGLLQVLPRLCGGLVEHEWGLLCTPQGQLLTHWGELPPNSQAFVHSAHSQARPCLQGGSVAFPLQDAGVLALGRTQPFTPNQFQCLEVMAQQFLIAWLRAQALEQLRQYQQQLVLSSQMVAVGGLAAGVAHELNSPLGAISLLLDGSLRQLHSQPEAAQGKLERAQQACLRARAIVDKLLTQARDPNPAQTQYRLDDCLREGLTFVKSQLDVPIELQWSDNPTFVGQPSTVQQVMINLLHNAAQANTPKIVLQTYPWGFAVTDWGVGLSDEVAARIFEPFYTTRRGGNGLGLWICQDLLRQQGAYIRVLNREGTRFEVHLISEASGNP